MMHRDPTPFTTPVRTTRAHNIVTDRLLVRLEYLRTLLRRTHEWAEQKSDFKARVREVIAIEDELDRRAVNYTRVSRRAA